MSIVHYLIQGQKAKFDMVLWRQVEMLDYFHQSDVTTSALVVLDKHNRRSTVQE